jgi:hypothetical protein
MLDIICPLSMSCPIKKLYPGPGAGAGRCWEAGRYKQAHGNTGARENGNAHVQNFQKMIRHFASEKLLSCLNEAGRGRGTCACGPVGAAPGTESKPASSLLAPPASCAPPERFVPWLIPASACVFFNNAFVVLIRITAGRGTAKRISQFGGQAQ